MKYLKTLSLAVIAAAALMAIVGAGTASATSTLCKVTEEECSLANMWPEGTPIHAVLAPETHATLTPSGELPEITCKESTISGSPETTTTPEGAISVLSFGSCEPQEVETLETGRLQVHWDEEAPEAHNGALTASGVRVRVKAFFGSLSCDFGGEVTSGLTLTGGSPAHVDATATIPMIKETGFITCPENAIWHAEYEVTAPASLYVSKGV
jgi:hypothetical protein